MLTITERTTAFVAETIEDIVNEIVTVCVPKGYYHFWISLSPDDTETFDRETLNEIDSVKWRLEGEGYAAAAVKYLRWGRMYILMATADGFFFDAEKSRAKDIRETPLIFCGCVVTCDSHPIPSARL